MDDGVTFESQRPRSLTLFSTIPRVFHEINFTFFILPTGDVLFGF